MPCQGIETKQTVVSIGMFYDTHVFVVSVFSYRRSSVKRHEKSSLSKALVKYKYNFPLRE